MSLSEKRVLIVDDSKFVRTTFNRILSDSFAVREESDGEAAWQAIQSDPSIVVVFSDLDMPRLDGFSLLKRIRGATDARVRDLPVVVISGSQDQSSRTRALDAGATDFIAKSADAPEVMSRIASLLRLAKSRGDLVSRKLAPAPAVARDALTGALTGRELIAEGRKRFSQASAQRLQLAAIAFRIDSHADAARDLGKDVADQLLARIGKVAAGALRPGDALGRVAEATFVIISAGADPSHAVAFARQLCGQLESAQVAFRNQVLRIRSSCGIACLPGDAAGSIEELMKLALQRLAERAVVRPLILPKDIERAVQVLERADPERIGAAAGEIVRRLSPFLKAAAKQMQKPPATEVSKKLAGQ